MNTKHLLLVIEDLAEKVWHLYFFKLQLNLYLSFKGLYRPHEEKPYCLHFLLLRHQNYYTKKDIVYFLLSIKCYHWIQDKIVKISWNFRNSQSKKTYFNSKILIFFHWVYWFISHKGGGRGGLFNYITKYIGVGGGIWYSYFELSLNPRLIHNSLYLYECS